ncbi:hypothetical protein HK102_006160 [Quaeritorhiza haematococci]|nr:hypothetical protein HK102_006160 [Quaeritorhiza haematococci]
MEFWITPQDRKSNKIEDDLIIFPEEAEFIKVKQSSGRVYVLRFKSSSQRLFFWVQEPSEDADAALAKRINDLINDPSAAAEEPTSPSQAVSPSSDTATPAAAPNSATTAQPPSTATGGSGASQSQLEQLRNILASISVPAGAGQPDLELSSILTPANVSPLLQDRQVVEALFPHLPEGAARTPEEVQDVIRSPQFAQSMQMLSTAIRSGQIGPLLQQLGVDANASRSLASVREFLQAIQDQVRRQDGERADMDETE